MRPGTSRRTADAESAFVERLKRELESEATRLEAEAKKVRAGLAALSSGHTNGVVKRRRKKAAR